MDPIANIREQRALARKLLTDYHINEDGEIADPEELYADAQSLAALSEALMSYIAVGGFVPRPEPVPFVEDDDHPF